MYVYMYARMSIRNLTRHPVRTLWRWSATAHLKFVLCISR